METQKLLLKVASKALPHELENITKWLLENAPLIESVSKETFNKFVEMCFNDKVKGIEEVERMVGDMDWEERLELMKNGVQDIKKATTSRQQEVALMIKLLDLSDDLVSLLLKVI